MPNANETPRRRGTIQSVDRAARILKALGSGPRRLGVSQLADQLGLSRPTVHGLLQTLAAHGFVEQDRDSDKYQLGAGLLHLGNSYLDLNELRARSLVHAERLAARTGAAVRVGVLHGASVTVVHHVFRPDTTFQVLEVGAQLPAHASALGKAMLAYAPEAVLAELLAEPLPKLTNRTLTAKALEAELEAVREHGIARERDEAVLGESSVAAPITDHSAPCGRRDRRGGGDGGAAAARPGQGRGGRGDRGGAQHLARARRGARAGRIGRSRRVTRPR